ncbi:MAG: hypothetical protein Q8K02_02400 [Flavobacterium sp.]|nr:hypothetical protein [Flavobacterium sp.]
MNQNNTQLEKILENGYELDFSSLLEKAFNNYKKIALTAGLLFILITIIAVIIGFSIGAMFLNLEDLESLAMEMAPAALSLENLIVYVLGVSFISGLASPLTAGFFKIAHLAEKNQPFSISNAFDYYKSHHFLQLFIASFLITFIGIGVNSILEYNSVMFYGALFTYIVSFFTFLTIPLIIFADVKGTDAIHYSIQLVLKQPLILLGLLIVSIIASMVGLIGFCIGIFFTLPFYYSMIYSIYDSIFLLEDETDEIGKD